jgi:acetyl esterase
VTGSALDPQARAFLARLRSANRPPFSRLTPAQARSASAALTALMGGPPEPLARVLDRSIPGPRGPIPIRIYTPHGATEPAPVLVYFHGGGFVIGDIAMVDETCRLLAAKSGCIVVSVDYRLAPEHPYPAPREDAFAATAWVAREGPSFGADPHRLAVGGDSAGGTLAAVTSLASRAAGGPEIAFQLLVYPGSDRDFTRPSMVEFGEDYLLTTDTMRWFHHHHTGAGADERDPYLTPLAATDLTGLPPALVITAGFDPLRDGGELYAARLKDAGVPVELVRYDGMIHGFFAFPNVFDAARNAIAVSASALRRHLDAGAEVPSLVTE